MSESGVGYRNHWII